MKRVAIDTETTGLYVQNGDRPFAVGMCFDDGSTRYWEWPVDPMTRMPEVNQDDVAEIQKIAGSRRFVKEFWNLKFDVNMLASIGVEVVGPMAEGMFMARACNNLEYNYRLKYLAKKYVEFSDADEKDLKDAVMKCRRIAKKLGWNLGEKVVQDYWLPNTLALKKPRLALKHDLVKFKGLCKRYCECDVERTILLCSFYRVGMDELDVNDVYEFEMDLLQEVTLPMERRGVAIDPDRLKKVEKICQAAVAEAHEVLVEASGNPDFNVGSTKQVQNLLFYGKGPQGIKIQAVKRNKNGDPKVDAEALMPHKDDPRVEAVLKYRANAKAMSSFFSPYKKFSTPSRHGMILRTTWNQWGTLTGRYTSQSPSLQVVPNPKTTNSKAAEYVIDVRQVFIPRRGCIWYCPDYSQVEVIIFADIAQEPTMLKAIREGVDIHAATANAIWGGKDNPRVVDAMKTAIIAAEREKEREGYDFEEYDRGSSELRDFAEDILFQHDYDIAAAESSIGVKIYRKLAKSATFTKIFGGGPVALMGWIGVSRGEAQAILRQYDNAFPAMAVQMKAIEREGKENGFVVNPFGRRLMIDRWRTYTAVNYLVQSAAADLMKRGMLKCARMLKERVGDHGRIIMTIHDELVFEFKKGWDKPGILRKICKLMSDHEGVFEVDTPVHMDRITERWSVGERISI